MGKAKALKIKFEFYCTKEGPCPRKYNCITEYEFACAGGYPFRDICPYLIIKAKALNRKAEEQEEDSE